MNFEFITHGGFELVVEAWLFLSNFFNNPDTSGLIATIFIAAGVFSAIAGPLAGMIGGRADLSTYTRFLLVGTTLWYLLISGSAQITIYDDVKNKTQTIGSIPPGLAAMAGFASSMRTGLEHVIENVASPPVPLADEGYGLGMKMLQESRDGVMQSALAAQVPEAVYRSASNYASECLAIEAAHTASIGEGLQKTDDQKNVWPLAGNPALFVDTNIDGAGNPTDTVENVSCDVAWQRLNTYFGVAGPWQSVVDDYCKIMSFDTTDPTQAQRCRDVYGSAIHTWVATGMTSENFAQNIFLGSVWHNYLASLDSSVEVARAAGNQQVQSSMAAVGIMAADFMPVFKEVLIALIIMMTALVALFFVTGVGLEAFQYLFFLYVFWVLFSATDTAIACLWQSQINNLFAVIKGTNMVGTAGLDKLWPMASKSLAMLGKMRLMGMLLVSSVMLAVFKWGGSAWAHLASNIASAFQMGAGVAGDYLSPGSAGQARTMSQAAQMAESYHRAIAGGMTRMGMDYAAAGANVAGAWGGGGQFKAGQDLGLGSTAHEQAGGIGGMRGKQLAQGLGQADVLTNATDARNLSMKSGTNARVGTESGYSGITGVGGTATATDLKTQAEMKAYAGTLATRAMEEVKQTGGISPETRGLLDGVKAQAGGGQHLTEAFNRVSVTPANAAEAKHLADIGISNAQVGRAVTASMYYGADGKLHSVLNQAEGGDRTTVGTRFEGGSSYTTLDTNRFDTNRSVLVNGDVLGTGQSGLYMVTGKGARAGSMLNFENATVTDMQTGQKIDRPYGMTMMLDPQNPAAAFSRAGNAAHLAATGKPYDAGAALHLNNIDSTMHQDRYGVSGGFSIDNQAITQRVSTLASHGGAGGADIFGGHGAAASHRNLAYSNAYVNDLGGIVTRKGSEILRSSLDINGSLYANWSVGKIGFMQNITGFDAGAKMEVKDAIMKAAQTDSGVDLVKSAAYNIWNSEHLTPHQKAVALDAMRNNLIEEASSQTRTHNPADPGYERPRFSTLAHEHFVGPYEQMGNTLMHGAGEYGKLGGHFDAQGRTDMVRGIVADSGLKPSHSSRSGGKKKEDMYSAYGGGDD